MRRVSDTPFMETDGQSRSRKRFTGWYDENILGAEGEALLARYDDAAASYFIDRGLTYRTRRSRLDLNLIVDPLLPDHMYFLEDVDTNRLRLFALSLLWRAAVSTLEPFNKVVVSPAHLRDIAARLRAGDAGDYRDYPVRFAVFDGAEELTKIAPTILRDQPSVRFFLDGIVCYVCPRRRWRKVKEYGGLIAGYEPRSIAMMCYSSARSWHHELAVKIMMETREREGDVFAGFGPGHQ
ncbi:MAG: hypothetical protein ABI810_08090 [Sphingomonas bacterium]